MTFTINVFPEEPDQREKSLIRIYQGIVHFEADTFANRRYKKTDETLTFLLDDLRIMRYWGVLDAIDGSQHLTQGDTPEKREEKRRWAREMFDQRGLQQLLDLSVNIALHIPERRGWPGTYRGHSILYRELVTKKDSMFHEAVDGGFKVRLNNGRFWEELVYSDGASVRTIHDVLCKYFGDLSIDFIQKGWSIFERGKTHAPINLSGLPKKAILRYGVWIKRVHESHRIPEERIDHLLYPYVRELIAPTVYEDEEITRWKEGEVEQLLNDPLIRERMRISPFLQSIKKPMLTEL